MRRLYLQIYLAMLGALLLYGVLAAAASFAVPPNPRERRALDGLAAALSELLPASSDRGEAQRRLDHLGHTFAARLTLLDAAGGVIASTGPPLQNPAAAGNRWWRLQGGLVLRLELPDGRVLLAQHPHVALGPHRQVFAALGVLALVVAGAAWPVARRLTKRLERLRRGVDGLGRGDLAARVPVEGEDEVAQLAATFNGAAERIESLVRAQQRVLAGASHELRSPLARLQMATELLEGRDDLKRQVRQDVAELDALIGELLLASRLEAVRAPEKREDVELLALAAEEAARSGASVEGQPVVVAGDARLLRRLLRNLLDNAARHARGAGVQVRVERLDGRARLVVGDRGPGIPEAERERIFEPFHRLPGAGESEGGVGLGLSLVRQIARHHGGEVRAVGREGGGTSFEVTLPL